ncbi:MAG: hybrid sensor histidine kinase/response regulator, partial [Rubrivivax sp.]
MDNSKASPVSDDLSALAWVYEELRKSLESAHKALQRALKESGATGFSDIDALDPAILRNARQQIHQGVGALELAGLPAGAMLLRASEAVVQRFVNRPQSIHIDGVKAVESASFALLDLMRRRLAGKPVSVLALFPQYEALLDLAGTELARPSDLWIQEWPAVMLETPLAPPEGAAPREADADAVTGFELALLKLLRSGQPADARPLVTLCSQLAAGAHERQAPREAATWVLACGFLEAIAEQRLDWTVHVKRVLSALLSQLRTLTRQGVPSDRLAHELLFFCAQAAQAPHPAGGDPGRVLDRLREAFHLDHHAPVDLAQPSLGRFDPAWVTQAAKRVTAAKDGWSAVAAGELLRLGGLNEQFSLVADSLKRLYPDGEELASALTDAVSGTVQSGQSPEAALAMEVATGLLYLDASLDEAEFEQPEERQRVQRLAHRIRAVRAGEPAEPLEPWMEALYRHVSDRQTIGSVVQELRTTLGECEKRIDQFFRDPETPAPLMDVPSQLQSMKGVLAVLGLDAAAHAVSRMRGDVEALLLPDADHQAAAQAGVHDRLASNLGAVGFLVDMLAVQPGLAKNLFVFNEESGVLAPIMGRAAAIDPADVDPIALMVSPSEQVERVRTQEVAETLVESAVRDDVPLLSLSDELQVLADTPLVQEQADLAASVASAQAALERAADHGDDEQVQQQSREEVVAALNDFVQSMSEPMGLDPLPDVPAELAQPPLVPFKPTQPEATGLEEDDEMRDIFIEEAREVVTDAREAVQGLEARPDDISLLTTIRRAFHTLKGSSRMVGLNEFGEAGWACEQLYNTWLASQQPASEDLQGFTAEALDHLAAWVEAIDARQAGGWSPQGLVHAADALRLEQRRVPIGGHDAPPAAEGPIESIEVAELSVLVDSPHLPAQAIEAIEAEPAEALVQTEKPVLDELAEPPADDAGDAVDLLVLDLSSGEEEPLLTAALAEPEPLDRGAEASEGTPNEPVADALGDVPPPALSTEALAPIETAEAFSLDLLDADAGSAGQTGEAGTDHAAELPLSDGATVPEDALAAEAAEPAQPDEADAADDQVKVIGPLRISIPLFNIYLNEADEQSRRLSVMLSEWALEWHRPLGDEAIALAHSLAGNSGAVGYAELSQLARLLEHALTRSQALGIGDEVTAALFNEAADEIRRLLHQFAAGFLKSPQEELMRRLAQFETQELPRHDPRGHLRLVHSAEEADSVPAAEPIDQVSSVEAGDAEPVAPLDLAPVTLTEPLLDDTGQPLDPAHLADLDLNLPATDEVPAIDAAAIVTEAAGETDEDDADAPHSLPAPLGLPELRPFEPLPDAPRADLLQGGGDVDLGEDADIDAVDAVDPDLFPIFEEEALELLPQLAGDMRQWGLNPAQAQWADASMRTLHTFKGGARLAGAMRLGELAHRMESAIERLMSRDAVTTADVDPLLARLDVLAEVFEALQRRDLNAQQEATAQALASVDTPADQPADLLATDIDMLSPASAETVAQDAEGVDEAVIDIALIEAEVEAAVGDQPAPVAPIDWSSVRQDFVAGIAPGAEAGGASVIATVRVRPRLLDRLVNHAGEVSISRTRLSSQVQQM